jgi:endonuclease IV
VGRELLVGAHMSIAGGIHLAFDRGLSAGCRTLQVFLKNSTQWQTSTCGGGSPAIQGGGSPQRDSARTGS